MLCLDEDTGFVYAVIEYGSLDVDLMGQLANTINRKYRQDSNKFNYEIGLIDNLRRECVKNLEVDAIDFEIITKLKRYSNLISRLIEIFDDDDDIEFKWDDILFNSLIKERAFVMYQISSYYNLLAIRSLKDDEEEGKKAGVYFQYSAGCFELYQSWCEKYTLEYDSDEISSLIFLMLAQSQELYLIKAVSDNLKESVMIKLSNQISTYYLQLGKHPSTESWLSEYYFLKEIYYLCYSWYLFSEQCLQKGNIDESCGYKVEIGNKLDELTDINDPRFSKYLQEIENLRVKAKVTVPVCENFDVAELPKAIVVKCLIPKDLNDEIRSFDTLFELLQPLSKVKIIGEYEKNFDEFLLNELYAPIGKMKRTLEDELNRNKLLESEINDIYHGSFLPQTILDNNEKFVKSGGFDELLRLNGELNTKKNVCREQLDAVWEKLRKQTEEEIKVGEIHGAQWNLGLIENDSVGSILLKNFRIFENYMDQTAESDNLIDLQIKELEPYLKEIFNYDSQESNLMLLEKRLPDSLLHELNNEFFENTKMLNDHFAKLQELRNDLEKFKETIQKMAKQNQILKKGLRTPVDKLDSTLKDEIFKYSKQIEELESLKIVTTESIAKFRVALGCFNRDKKDLRVTVERSTKIDVLNLSFQGYFEVLNNLTEGLEFYNNLQGNIKVKQIQLEKFLSKRARKIASFTS